jgi:Ca2+-binding EF-hand superfamily protein
MDAFQMLDKTGKGWISAYELSDVIKELGVYANHDDVYLFIRRYDKDNDGRL